MLKRGHYFENQPRDEKIILVKRRHWLAYSAQLILIVFLILIPFGLFFYMSTYDLFNIRTLIMQDYINLANLVVFTSCYILIVLALFIYSWENYYLNIVIITSEHLVDIKQVDWFQRKVSEQSLLRVQDVSSKMQGFLQTFFKVGTVYVETAGEAPNFVMPNIHKPYEMSNTIMTYQERMIQGTNQKKNIAVAEGEIAAQKKGFNDVSFKAEEKPILIKKESKPIPNNSDDISYLSQSKKVKSESKRDGGEIKDGEVIEF